jgi:2-oxoglutarate dehydrogenase E1 component
MEASLQVPTATSVRTLPVRTLEENRRLLNKHREGVGASKVSFTHVVAWAILRALDTFPRLNDAYAEVEGRPHRIQRDEVRLGIAVDVQKKDGSRTLLVPNIKGAQKLSFPEFLAAFDELVARSRKGAISPDDFMGTTVSLTNPGTLGTTSSAPRLMPGQGVIVATGALDYPAEYKSMAPRTLGMLGISKVMTITSTYDHRIIQGADSGLFLSRIEELLKGDDGFYERIFTDLGMPHRPVRWEMDANPGLFGAPGGREEVEKQTKVLQLIHNYRVRGHLVADLDPLDRHRAPHRDLDPASYGLTLWDLDREFMTGGLSGEDRANLREILDILRETYCGTIGVEYMYIADPERKEWLQHRMESARNYPALDAASKKRVLEKVIEAESFERFLHTKYVGHKRFSLEGGETLIPLLDRILNDAALLGLREVVIGMSHRGRLNVLANTVGKPIAQIFAEFEGNDPTSYQGSGDVKYHLGATGTHLADTGETIAVTVAPNPSHLEFVNPVVEGIVRAKQDAMGDKEHARVLPLLLHGDAAFAGQGIVAETMHLSGLHGYRTGGTIHVVVNNQIGFTTLPEDARSSTYATDVAKMVHAPALHVNGDDPEAVAYVASLALEYRQKFKKDVVIDLVCYRRWGHNETDEPSYTQPIMYARIKNHPSAASLYGDKLVREGTVTRDALDALWAAKKAEMQSEAEDVRAPFAAIARREPHAPAPVDAPAMWGRLKTVLKALGTVPEGIEIHPKLLPFVRKRAELLEGKGEVDWSTGEALGFGTLLLEGVPVRLSGQDTGRGTFSQRHAVLHDVRTQQEYVPLNAIAPTGVRFEVFDSLLSENAVLGFEFGYSVAEHRTLTLWEAQFGDFMNGAQVIIDQFIASSETKWGQPSGPHAAAAARLRGAGARALERAHRALLVARRRGQPPRRLPLDAGLVLPPAALPGP